MSGNEIHSYALGIATQNSNNEIIEVFYPQPLLSPSSELTRVILDLFAEVSGNGYVDLSADTANYLSNSFMNIGDMAQSEIAASLATSKKAFICALLRDNTAPSSIPEAFLKLHLLSHRLAMPHQLNLDGLFGVLKNLAWTNHGAIDLDDLPKRQLEARINDEPFDVYSVDKFPKMTSYVVPAGVRIANTARIRLGSYIGEGTTFLHEGLVNFNAGTKCSVTI